MHAAGLARHQQARLVLLHVRQDALLLPDEYPSRRSRRTERHTRDALQQLAQVQLVATEVAMAEEWLPVALAAAALHHNPLLLVLGRPAPAAVSIEIVTSATLDLLRYSPARCCSCRRAGPAPRHRGSAAPRAAGPTWFTIPIPRRASCRARLK